MEDDITSPPRERRKLPDAVARARAPKQNKNNASRSERERAAESKVVSESAEQVARPVGGVSVKREELFVLDVSLRAISRPYLPPLLSRETSEVTKPASRGPGRVNRDAHGSVKGKKS